MPLKPDRQNPFWPAVPKKRTGLGRTVLIVGLVVLALIAIRFGARIVLG